MGFTAWRCQKPGVRRTIALLITLGTLFGLWLLGRASSQPLSINPASAAKLEAAMWRDYYEHRWVSLAWRSFLMARKQFGFSFVDSLQLAWHAAQAARAFSKDTQAEECLPELRKYYKVAKRRFPRIKDVSELADLELRWWKQRREGVNPEVYSWTIAELTARIYGGNVKDYYSASRARVMAMAWRDERRNGGMGDAEWEEVARQLETAWRLLSEARDRFP